jgi:RNA-splicing ligase RtcB
LCDLDSLEDSKIRIMADVCPGIGTTIGSTFTYDNVILPSLIGSDIGCGIVSVKLNTKRIELGQLDAVVRENLVEKKRIDSIVSRHQDNVNLSKLNCIKQVDIDRCYSKLGELGGGNHFIEFGDCEGKYAFTVHCGSRNFGVKVAKYWTKIASSNQVDNKLLKEAIKELKKNIENKKELPQKIYELTEEFKSRSCSNGYLMGENMVGYLTDMVIAQAYAKFNHKLICDKIAEILYKINGAKVIETIQSIHNYVSFDDKIIRKGAIKSYEGEKMIIPFNMRDGLAICVGKSNADWNYSAPHGAGRIMSRSKAKANISLEEFKESMNGIYTTSVCKNTIDESPMAYKDTNVIIEHIKDTCDILYMVKPVINIKSTDEEE